MTHGEAYFAEKESLKLVKGVWRKTIKIENKLPPMSRVEAGKYYTGKLFKYWLGCISDTIPEAKKEDVLKIMMFGNPANSKLLKEG